jgi:two-component system chemotaxis response regulator CheB
MTKIRVLVVDDSALMRKMIPHILASDPEIEVVGTAMDGVFALKKIAALHPDVITLDVNMPRMDGLETLRHIVEDFGTPSIIVSSVTVKDADLTLQALEIGAFDFVAKPQDAISLHMGDIRNALIQKIKAAYFNPIARLKIRRPPPVAKERQRAEPRRIGTKPAPSKSPAESVLAIGASTGGPNALSYLLPQLPQDFPAAILVVQHMPAGFTEMFAKRLDSICKIRVKEAEDGDLVLPGRALIAPGNRHLKIKKLPLGTVAVLSDTSPVNGHRPSVDVLFRSAASEYGSKTTGVIMTGMGSDGAQGIGEIKEKGGITVAQDEDSCVVFGMPKAAIEKNYVTDIVTLDRMGDFLITHSAHKMDGVEAEPQ